MSPVFKASITPVYCNNKQIDQTMKIIDLHVVGIMVCYDNVLVWKRSGTSIRSYFIRSDILGNIPIESFTGIKYFKIILVKSKKIQTLAYLS
jgi:hypothetical protein